MNPPTDFESRLRDLLHERAGLLGSDVATGPELQKLVARFPRERRRGVMTVVAAAAAVVTLAGSVTAAAVELAGRSGAHDAVTTPGPVLPAPAVTITPVALPRGAEAIRGATGFVTPSPDLVINGVLWVDDIHDARVVRVDPATMRILGSTSYPGSAGAAVAQLVRVGDVVLLPIGPIGASASSGQRSAAPQILRFDASTGKRLASIPVSVAGPIAVTPGGVFAAVGADTVGLLDAARGRVLRTFHMTADRSLAYADGLLWGWDQRRSLLVGVDVGSGTRARQWHLPGYSDRPLVAIDRRTLLVGAPGGVAELDAVTGRATAFTHAAALNYARDGRGGLWGIAAGRTLVELDAASLSMLRGYQVSSLDLVAIAGDRLFAADFVKGQVRAFDLGKLRSGG